MWGWGEETWHKNAPQPGKLRSIIVGTVKKLLKVDLEEGRHLDKLFVMLFVP